MCSQNDQLERPAAFGRRIVAAAATAILLAGPLAASDHADPIDLFMRQRLEPGITDLFVFPTKDNGEPASPFQREDKTSLAKPGVEKRKELSADQVAETKNLVVILCVRRALTEKGSLQLEPYTYRIHMDLHSTVSYEDSQADLDHAQQQGAGYRPRADEPGGPPRPTGQEARARYGGTIERPDKISPDVTIELRLNNDATLNGNLEFPVGGLNDPDRIEVATGIFDDPFIFPAFFRTNIVGMVLRIPIDCFPEGQRDWIVWATSHEGGRQIDHVGRSLRTQNPRFELLNTLPPSEHAAAIHEEHEHPGLLRDLAVRFNLASLFAYRAWDQVPDVMIYTNRFPVGFPNGRLLEDDVAALLAQHGDTLLLELSHHIGGWPRQTTNDKPFLRTAEDKLLPDQFPYLAEPWPDRPLPAPPSLSTRNILKLIGIAIGLIALLVLENWIVARIYHRWKLRRRYL